MIEKMICIHIYPHTCLYTMCLCVYIIFIYLDMYFCIEISNLTMNVKIKDSGVSL